MRRAVALTAVSKFLQQFLTVGLLVTLATFLGHTVIGVTIGALDVDVF